jgi:hypothetical protein
MAGFMEATAMALQLSLLELKNSRLVVEGIITGSVLCLMLGIRNFRCLFFILKFCKISFFFACIDT